MDILFAQGRRTLSSWLRAAAVSNDFSEYYDFIAAVRRKTEILATRESVEQSGRAYSAKSSVPPAPVFSPQKTGNTPQTLNGRLDSWERLLLSRRLAKMT